MHANDRNFAKTDELYSSFVKIVNHKMDPQTYGKFFF